MNTKFNIIIALLFLAFNFAFAQAPTQINYQGVARDTAGNAIANQNIKVRFKIRHNASNGTIQYQETRTLTTSATGLFTAQIGGPGGSGIIGTVGGVTWNSGTKYLQVEMDPTGGSSFVNMGAQLLVSTPYALSSREASSLAVGATISTYQIGATGAFPNQVLQFNGSSWVPTTLNTASNLTLPYAGSDSSLNNTFYINNKYNDAAAHAIVGEAKGGIGLFGHSNSVQGVYGSTDGSTYAGVFGYTYSPTGIGTGGRSYQGTGVFGETTAAGIGVRGTSGGTTSGIGVKGTAAGTTSFGVLGENTTGTGVKGISTSATAIGVLGENSAGIGVKGVAAGAAAIGVLGQNSSGTGVKGISTSATAIGVLGENSTGIGVKGLAAGATAIGVLGENTSGIGVKGTTTGGSNMAGVYGINTGTVGNGVLGVANFAAGYGVQGTSTTGTGVLGYSNDLVGVYGSTINGIALKGYSNFGYGLEVTGKVKIAGGNTSPGVGKVLTSDASGNATWEVPPVAAPKVAFRGVDSENTFANGQETTLTFDYEEYDLNTGFNPGTGKFVAPVSGIYHFDASTHIIYDGLVYNISSPTMVLKKQYSGGGSTTGIATVRGSTENLGSSGSRAQLQLSTDVHLFAGDQVWITVQQYNGAGDTIDTQVISGGLITEFFSGHLITVD